MHVLKRRGAVLLASATVAALGFGGMVAAPAGATPPTGSVPGSPTGATAVQGGANNATVSWTAPASTGGQPLTKYIVTSTPDNKSCVVTTLPLATSCTVNSLTYGTSYTFAVTAVNSRGVSAPSTASNSVTPVTVPGQPKGLAYLSGNQSTSLRWTAPSNGGSPLLGYQVVVTPACPSCTGLTPDGSATSTVVSGLTNYTQYKFTIRAQNAQGWGPYSYQTGGNTPTDSVIFSDASWHFDYPWGSTSTVASGKIWVTNYLGNSVSFASLVGDGITNVSGGDTQFNGPGGIASDGTNVWVANYLGNSVTELDGTTGAVITVVRGVDTGLNGPSAVAYGDGHIWVTNHDGNSVTELNTDGTVASVISGDGINAPVSVTVGDTGGYVWIVNYTGGTVRQLPHYSVTPGTGSITILNPDGSQFANLSNSTLGAGTFGYPTSISIDGSHAWIAQDNGGSGAGSVLELSDSVGTVGQLTQKITDASLSDSQGISSNGLQVFVTNYNTNTVTTLSAATGGVNSVLSGINYQFNGPLSVYNDGTDFWVTNALNNTITKVLVN